MEGNSRNLTIFATYLRNMKHWDGFVVDPWEANDSLQHCKGKHTKEFMRNTTNTVNLLKRLIPGERISNFCKCLTAFRCMCSILGMLFIDEYESASKVLILGASEQQTDDEGQFNITTESTPRQIANAVILKYEAEVKNLYKFGHKTFMTRRNKGDAETFYLHTLYNYIPKFLKLTYDRHRLGVAVFSMESFEYKNYTSKNVVLNRTNRKGNICQQSLRVLQLYYKVSYHNISNEMQTRNKRAHKTEELKEKEIERVANDLLQHNNEILPPEDTIIEHQPVLL